MQVTVDGIVTYVEPEECYIESPDRSGGIWVIGPTVGIEIGDPVIAFGTFAMIDGEPAVIDASIYPHGAGSEIRPLGMSNHAVGGASKWSPLWIWDYANTRVPLGHGWVWQRNWVLASGASNTGLLVTTWGMVKSTYYSPATGAKWFYIDDGSACASDLGDTGLLVYSDAEVTRGDAVAVTGVSSVEPSKDVENRLIRTLRTRSAGDVQVLKPYEPPVYPFSDEFDSPTLDPRWAVDILQGQFSLTDNPGWLTLTPTPASSTHAECKVFQRIAGDWDMELKLRVEWSSDTRYGSRDCGARLPQPFTTRFYVRLWYGQTGPAVAVPESAGIPMVGDTCYFRVRKRGLMHYSSVSFDGSSYCAEYSARREDATLIELYAFAGYSEPFVPDPPFRVHFDYIRITTVSQ